MAIVSAALLAGLGFALWSFLMSDLPIVVVVVIGVVIAVAVLWGIIGFRHWRLGGRPIENTVEKCDRPHTTNDERRLLGWASTLRNYDIENINGYLKTQVTIDVNAIYSHTAPTVLIHLDMLNSAVHHVLIGREVRGYITDSPHRLGDTPKPRLGDNLESITLGLNRGEEGRFTLEQPVTDDLRNMWIRNRLGQTFEIDLTRLGVSVELSNPYQAGFVHRDNLQLPDCVKVRLDKVQDWPWQDSPWREWAEEQGT